MKLIFYFSGHNYEYECRNALRIFDLNIDCEIKRIEEFTEIEKGSETHAILEIEKDDKIKETDKDGLILISTLSEENGAALGKACLYFNDKLIFESEYKGNEIILECENDKKLKKTIVVKAIHQVLKSYYNVTPDYGILTGVRVVKIMITARKHNKTNNEITQILQETYEVTHEKIQFLWDILKIEEKYINEKNNNNYNLYIGIPFCPSKCIYCSFTSFVGCREEKINEYIESLAYETEETIKMAIKRGLNLNTIYIGGGTPSILNENQINTIFAPIKKHYDLSVIREITFEAGRPDTLTEEKLICLKENNVNRISINPQTMNEKTLQTMERNHTIEDIVQKYEMARKIGFECINMDIILGLPGEDETDVKTTISQVSELRPENITVHALAYKKKSELTRESEKLYKDYDLIKKMNDVIHIECSKAGYNPYYMYRQKNIKGNSENAGFTLPAKEGIYNIVITEELESILACGLGASSKIKISSDRHVPVHNFKSLEEYKSRMDEMLNKKKELLL